MILQQDYEKTISQKLNEVQWATNVSRNLKSLGWRFLYQARCTQEVNL